MDLQIMYEGDGEGNIFSVNSSCEGFFTAANLLEKRMQYTKSSNINKCELKLIVNTFGGDTQPPNKVCLLF